MFPPPCLVLTAKIIQTFGLSQNGLWHSLLNSLLGCLSKYRLDRLSVEEEKPR